MKMKNEKGALILEASIIFPIMFLVIFFMIYTGNVYLQRCRVESIINRYALEGAVYCADPMIFSARNIPASEKEWTVYPYRGVSATGVGDVEGQIRGKITSAINKMGPGLFAGMEAKAKPPVVDYKNNIICATFTVDVDYSITMPIRMLGEDENIKLACSSHASAPVTDAPELIRNVEMVKDYAESSETVAKIKEKINDVVSKAKSWFG